MSQVKKEGLNGYQPCPKPLGLEAISKVCRELYPDQPNPLQVTALVKYWLGGPDPLDYITIYRNKATNTNGKTTPLHWHYVSCGFSDLHGDGRVHERAPSMDQTSGFGFELTFRLHGDGQSPPAWPAELLQALARYVFSSGNLLCVGDHISWHAPLDKQESRIQHMLLAPDPQLSSTQSALGRVQFLQVVGVTAEEVSAAQTWNGMGILKLMRASPVCGGELLITDMRRGESLFEAMPDSRALVDEGVVREGSLLSGVSAQCGWEGEQANETPSRQQEAELCQTIPLNRVHLKFNMEALQLLPLTIRGRLNHGRHFTFRSIQGDTVITFISDGIEGAWATIVQPLVACGSWLQVLLEKQDGEKLLRDIDRLLLAKMDQQFPITLNWPELHLTVTVVA